MMCENTDKCPRCGGPADNGFDRSWPEPVPYHCTRCIEEAEKQFTNDSGNDTIIKKEDDEI